jgi:hypothetical protein
MKERKDDNWGGGESLRRKVEESQIENGHFFFLRGDMAMLMWF